MGVGGGWGFKVLGFSVLGAQGLRFRGAGLRGMGLKHQPYTLNSVTSLRTLLFSVLSYLLTHPDPPSTDPLNLKL